jgi:hypothetical protein
MTSGPPDAQTEQYSPDGRWRWDGTRWVPAEVPLAWAPPPQPGSGQQPPGARPAFGPNRVATGGIASQFSGDAMWSCIFGLASVLVPLFTPIYFPILPLFGLWRGVLACRSGRVVGGVLGLVLNALGAIVSLLSSGLLFR